MNKKHLLSILCLISLILGSTGCSGGDNLMSREEREKMQEEATIVVRAFYEKTIQVEKRQQLDVIEGRKGYSTQVLKGLIFKTQGIIKGDYSKKQFLIGTSIPQMAFGIGPLEKPRDKLYTFYLLIDPQIDKEVLIGAEWRSYK